MVVLEERRPCCQAALELPQMELEAAAVAVVDAMIGPHTVVIVAVVVGVAVAAGLVYS